MHTAAAPSSSWDRTAGRGFIWIIRVFIANRRYWCVYLQGHGLSFDLANPVMFLRVVRATVSKGVKREYVRVVEAYRDRDGKTRHRTVINLGRRDVLAEHLDLGQLRR